MLQKNTNLHFYKTAHKLPYKPSHVTHYKTAGSPIEIQEDICDTRPRNYLLSSLFYNSVYIFTLVLAIAVVYMHDITPSTLVVILKNY
jgi:hypothetical protein